jgi:aldehyde dehydrogenase (NAD+)
LIGEEWLETGSHGVFEDSNPADRTAIVGVAPKAGEAEVRKALTAAAEGVDKWSAVSPIVRAEILGEASRIIRDQGEDLARLQTREMGKPIGEARGEVSAAVAFLEYMMGEGVRFAGETLPSSREGVTMMTLREPLGVMALITPWNFPISIPTKKLATALICGNAVILKPASHTPGVAAKIVEILVEAGVPKGVVNLITGPGSTVGAALVATTAVDGVSFTGSTEVGLQVAEQASSCGAKVQTEMGGKNPVIIMDDCDIDRAVHLVVQGAFRAAGQKCTATSRVIVQRGIYDRFVSKLLEETERVRVGNPLEEDTFMGPLVDETQMQKVLHYIDVGVREGARLLYGGERLQDGDLAKGYYVAPTIFEQVEPDMTIAREEIFGPVVALFSVDSFDEALVLANRTDYGLAGVIHTSNLRTAWHFIRQAQVGCVGVNVSTAGWEVQAPFGGIKDSGYGAKEQGSTAIDFCSRLKTVSLGI